MATTTAQKPAAKPAAKPVSRRNRDKETLYRPGSLSKWFAFSSILLVLALGWMVWKDYDRAWKGYQKSFFSTQLEMARAEKDRQATILADREEEVAPAREAVARAREALDRNTRYAQALEKRAELELDVAAADKAVKGEKGLLAPVRFEFEKARERFNQLRLASLKGRKYQGYEVTDGDIDSAYAAMKDMEAEINRAGDKLFHAETRFRVLSDKLQTANAKIAEFERDLTTATATLADIEADKRKAQETFDGLELLYDKNQWRNWPFLDFISPSIKVRQVVVDEIHDNWNFDTNVKVDRCITCHLGIDLPEWGNAANIEKFKIKPYMRAHVGLGLIAGKKSPHTVERVGCSVCHHGVGWSTDFSRAAHTPADAAERARWDEEHDYYKAKYIDYPMIPTEYVQGQCWKCHKEGIAWPVAYEEAFDHGFLQGKDPITGEERGQRRYAEDDMPAGASNRPLGPHEVFGEYALPKAPQPYRGTALAAAREQQRALYAHFADEEEHDEDHLAMLKRFADSSVDHYDWHADRFERGYDSMVTYGCQGCHKIQDFGQQVGYAEPPRVGPDLTYIADKVKPEWLDKWIKYPELYRIDTKMPSFFWFADKDREWNYRLGADGKRRVLPVTDAHMIYPDLAEKIGTNTTSEEIELANLQVLAMKTYLLNQFDPVAKARWTRRDPTREDFNPYYTEKLPPGDVERGRRLVATDKGLGCMACHVLPEIQVDGEWVEDSPQRFDFDPLKMKGPRLTSLGSKIADPGWLNAWLVNPRHYTSTTRMPDMRITDVVNEATGEVIATAEQQRADVIAYLMQFRDAEFDALPNVTFKAGWEATLRDMYETYFGKTADGEWVRRSSLAGQFSVDDPQSLASTLARVGERLMGRNGCFGCHEVAGHATDQPIGVELTREGTKNLHMLDFGAVPKKVIPHSRQDFFFHKLRTPRIWDWSKVKVWQDRLRMPRMNFRADPTAQDHQHYDDALADATVQEAEAPTEPVQWPDPVFSTRKSVVGIVLGLVEEPIQDAALYRPDAFQQDLIDGRRVIKRYGCTNCHTIEGVQGLLFGHFAEQGIPSAELPPNLFTQGLRTRSDWLIKFLKEPKYLRPIVNVHMPKFGLSDAEAGALARYFVRLAGRDQALAMPRPDSLLDRPGRPNYVDEAKQLFETINCNKCHLPKGSPGADPADGGVAPSFSHASERLRFDWVHMLLHDPARLIEPGTKMPKVWGTSRSYGRDVQKPYREFQFWLKDDPKWQAMMNSPDKDQQVEALKQLAEVQMQVVTDYLLWHYGSQK